MRKLLRNKKGVSPVIAAVLMIMVTVIGMSLLFAFFVNYTRDFQTGRGSASLESPVIEHVWKNGNNVEIWVYNIGKIPFTINDLHIINVETNTQVRFETNMSQTVNVGQLEKIDLKDALTSPSQRHLFRLFTERGSKVEVIY